MSLYLKYLSILKFSLNYANTSFIVFPIVLYNLLQPCINNFNLNLIKMALIHPLNRVIVMLNDLNNQTLYLIQSDMQLFLYNSIGKVDLG